MVVGLAQCFPDLDPVRPAILNLQSSLFDLFPEGFTFHVFHDDELLPLVFLYVVNGANVGMIEDGSSPGLMKKPFGFDSVEAGRKELQGDSAGP
jgi:hypothetical protein